MSTHIRALVGGLTQVDKYQYAGWDGRCPGSDVDAFQTAERLMELGAAVCLGIDATVKSTWVRQAGGDLIRGMNAGDLLVLYLSGHGGQQDDTDGDEDDGMDETLCLYDGEMTDDTVAELLHNVPTGVCIFSVFDTCNSGTSTRRPPARSIVKMSKAVLPVGHPHLHFGGCVDGSSSFGNAQGGFFTNLLWQKYNPTLTWQEWFSLVHAAMPAKQKPSMDVMGDFPLNTPALFRQELVFNDDN